MIQVLERAFHILEALSLDGEMTLENLSRQTALNKGTLCNILKAMIALGYVCKSSRGSYLLSEKLHALGQDAGPRAAETLLFREAAEELARASGESIVFSTLRGTRIAILAQSQPLRRLMVNEVICYARLSLYHSVSGRIILAHLPQEQREELFLRCGLPGEEWDGIRDLAALETACAGLRRSGLSVMSNEEEGIKAFALPVFDGRGRITAALGMTLPLSRLPRDGGTETVQMLTRKAARVSELLELHGFTADRFLHPAAEEKNGK